MRGGAFDSLSDFKIETVECKSSLEKGKKNDPMKR
jgi:hypothetical protein